MMSKEAAFAEALNSLILLAREQNNIISEEQLKLAFSDQDLDDDKLPMVAEYLKSKKIGIGEPTDPFDYMTDEETDYLKEYMEELALLPTLTDGQKRAYTISALAGDRTAKEQMMNYYLPQVVELTKLYAGQGVLVEDLIGEGNLALAMAFEMLDTLEGPDELEGHVGSMLMEAMENVIAESGNQKDSDRKMADIVTHIAEEAHELSQNLGRKVTITELSEETGRPILEIMDAVRLSGDAIEDIESNGK